MKRNIVNYDLTSESARDFLLEWLKDIPEADFKSLSFDENRYFGLSKTNNIGYIGEYSKVSAVSIDHELNPQNASDRGLRWVQDIIFDPTAPTEANRDILESVGHSFVFGEPANISSASNGMVGVYIPITNKTA